MEGLYLSSIDHAVGVAEYPELAYEQSWEGNNYNLQDDEGTRGTLTFYGSGVVAAFRNENTDRYQNVVEATSYFQHASAEVLKVVEEETLQYLIDDIKGEDRPFIATAFWIESDLFHSPDHFEELIENGGFLL